MRPMETYLMIEFTLDELMEMHQILLKHQIDEDSPHPSCPDLMPKVLRAIEKFVSDL